MGVLVANLQGVAVSLLFLALKSIVKHWKRCDLVDQCGLEDSRVALMRGQWRP